MEQRVFTRSDVEAFFMNVFNKDDLTYTVERIAILPGLTPPAWIIHHTAWHGESPDFHYSGDSVVYQAGPDDKPYLYFSVQAEVPTGLASPAEEDAEIELRKQSDASAY